MWGVAERKGKGMRKLLVLMMVVLLGMTVSFIVGCGSGDTATAKQDLKQAEADYNTLNKDLTQLQGQLTTAIGGAFSGNYATVTPQVVQSAEASISKALAEMPKIKADYQKVDSLKGVADYQAYADAMVKAIDASSKALAEGKKFIDGLIPIASNQAAMPQYFQTNAAAITSLQTLENDATTASQKAQSIKQDKKLTF